MYTRVNVLRVVMPPLRRILREAPDERRHYVHARRKGRDAWRGNLRELRNYVRNCILSSRLVSEVRDGA